MILSKLGELSYLSQSWAQQLDSHTICTPCLPKWHSCETMTNGKWSGITDCLGCKQCHKPSPFGAANVESCSLINKSVVNDLFTRLSILTNQYLSEILRELLFKSPSLVGAVNRSVAWGPTCRPTLTVREGMLRSHPPKWSPHVGNVKYSPALISLAPAVFLFTKPPSPNSSSPGVCGRVWWGRWLPPHPTPPPSSSISPYDLTHHLQGLNVA